MSFEFISNNQTQKKSSLDIGHGLLNANFSGYFYQPNFVLVNTGNTRRPTTSFFGDIVPIYSSTKELTSVIVTSWESLSSLVILSKTFAVCVLSFLNTVLHNTVYQAYTTLVSAYGQIVLLPEKYEYLQVKFENLIELFGSTQGREMWWLEVRLDIKNLLNKAYKLINLVLEVSKKFYLAWIIILVVGFLNYSAVFSNLSVKPNSFLSKFIQNYSVTASASPYSGLSQQESTLTTPYSSDNVSSIQVITQYEVADGDSLQQLSYKFGVSVDTLKFNNNITDDVTAGQKIYVPWVDGYIFTASNDISATQLASLYSVSKDSLIQQNQGTYDVSSDSFKKDSLVLIPTTDFAAVTTANQLLSSQKAQSDKDQASSNRQKILAQKSVQVSKNLYAGQFSPDQSANGFIMPADGYFSRWNSFDPTGCGYTAAHLGCDIASSPAGSKPPIFAVQKGVIKRVGFEAGGYGNFVEIDHGNGLSTLYAHLEEVYVKAGDIVSQGQAIGQMGATGDATGVHVHFEVHVNGDRVDPQPYLPSDQYAQYLSHH
jgi:murein DD-endopeptidase MepM/ murein hydrolase activator NlpD